MWNTVFEYFLSRDNTLHIYSTYRFCSLLILSLCCDVLFTVRILPRHLVHQQTDQDDRLFLENGLNRAIAVLCQYHCMLQFNL